MKTLIAGLLLMVSMPALAQPGFPPPMKVDCPCLINGATPDFYRVTIGGQVVRCERAWNQCYWEGNLRIGKLNNPVVLWHCGGGGGPEGTGGGMFKESVVAIAIGNEESYRRQWYGAKTPVKRDKAGPWTINCGTWGMVDVRE